MSDETALRCGACWEDEPPAPGLIVALVHSGVWLGSISSMTIAHRIADRTTCEVATVCGTYAPMPGVKALWYA